MGQISATFKNTPFNNFLKLGKNDPNRVQSKFATSFSYNLYGL